jgi:hypothetical protein
VLASTVSNFREAQYIKVVQIWVDPKFPDAHRDVAEVFAALSGAHLPPGGGKP